jgi:hypothetical protein
MSNKQDQTVSKGSTAIQAGGNVTVITQGMTVSEVRALALDIFRDNFHKLASIARETAEARAETITEEFLAKLQQENPKGLEQSNDPDFQYALFTVQKQFARNGDKELGDLLVDLLVDRTKHDTRDILQIVLNESLETAPKLTEQQLAVLATIFLFRYTQNFGIQGHEHLGQYFDKYVSPFTTRLVKNTACYQHLEFSGCGSHTAFATSLPSVLGSVYQGLFMKGFERPEIVARGVSPGLEAAFFVPCLNDAQRIQVRGINKDNLTTGMNDHAVEEADRSKIATLFDFQKMNEQEIQDKCVAIRPYMANMFDVWAESNMKQFILTSVGIAIGHANIKRLAGEFANLAIWIN